MLSSEIIDAIIYLYLGYCLLVGFRNGFFNVLVSIFGIYGACFLSWMFQGQALRFLVNYFGVSSDINPALLFILLWVVFYILIYISAKIITGAVQLQGVNFMIRISGAVLNSGKGAIVLMIFLTFLLSLSDTIYQETKTTKFLTGIGSKVMTLYNRNVDEQQIVPNAEAIIEESKDLIGDDFRQNLLER